MTNEQRIARQRALATELRSADIPARNALLERRYLRGEIRADNTGDRKRVAGFAARWNQISENLGGFREKLAPNCFARSLTSRPDVVLLNGHDPNGVLARCGNGTLSVKETNTGLMFDAELAATSLGNDTYENIRSGLIGGMSFSMICDEDSWEDCDDPEEGTRIMLRTVRSARISEISCTSFPAYPTSDVSARATALFPNGVPAELRSRLHTRGPWIDDVQLNRRRRLRLFEALLTL